MYTIKSVMVYTNSVKIQFELSGMGEFMRIALGQLDMIWEDKKASLIKAYAMVKEAKEAGADIIIFPEMTLTGFSMNLEKIGENPSDSWSVSKMQQCAKENDIAIGFGWSALPVLPDRKGTNRFTLIDKEGNKVTEYCKIHPFTYGGESESYVGGDKIVCVPFLGHTISLFICYDLRFPDIFQIASEKSDVMIVIANWPSVRSAHWQTLIRARAIETQSYVVGVNCYGSRDGETYTGDSLAVDSIGSILGEISGKEGVLICDIDDRAWNLRDKFNTRDDRRDDLYQKWRREQ